jgi:hypothetical protein
MIADAQNLYADDQAITATAVSENVIDHGVARNLGVGERIWLIVIVTVAFTDAGSDSTVAVTLETDDNVGFGSATVTKTLGTFAALSAVGTRFAVPLGVDEIDEQFSRLNFTVAGGSLTTGSLWAALVKDIGAFTAYPDNITITT